MVFFSSTVYALMSTMVFAEAFSHDVGASSRYLADGTYEGFEQVGSSLFGNPNSATGDATAFGAAVSLSSDGTRMAIGAVGEKNLAGAVSLYDYDGTSWNLKPGFLVEGLIEEKIGDSLALSADGSRVAIRRYGTPNDPVEVYDAETGAQLGPALQDCDADGKAVSISSDGNRVAVSCEHWIADDDTKKAGRVHIYDWNIADAKFDLQATLTGDVANANATNNNEFFGWASSFAGENGDRLAITSVFHSIDNGVKQVGQVQVFQLNTASDQWDQLGGDMLGEHRNGRFGASVDLAADGTIVVVGAPTTDSNDIDLTATNRAEQDDANGEVHVFELDSGSNTWTLKGQIVQGENAVDQFGRSVAISDDGTRFAASAGSHNETRGQVRLFAWDTNDWVQLHGDIEGLAENDEFGRGAMSVALSGNGYRLASGSQGAVDESGASTGRARVFDYQDDNAPSSAPSVRPSADAVSTRPSGMPSTSSAPSPAGIQTIPLGKFDWDLPKPFNVSVAFTSDSESEEIKLSYNISRRTATITVYENDCETFVAGNIVAISQDTENTSPTHSQLDVTLDINQLSVVSSSLWTNGATTGEGFIALCVRVDLVLDDTSQTSVNFHEQKLELTIDLSQGFRVTDIVLDREAADLDQQNAQVNFGLTSCQCNADADCLVNEILYQGDDVYICVFADPDSDIEISAVEEFDFVQDNLKILAIDNSTEDLLTAVLSVGKTAIIRSQMRSEFFVPANLGPVLAEGTVSIIFGGSARRSLRIDSIRNTGEAPRMMEAVEDRPFQNILKLAATPTPSASNESSADSKNHTGPLVGGILGGACAFAALIVAVALRKKRKDEEEKEKPANSDNLDSGLCAADVA